MLSFFRPSSFVMTAQALIASDNKLPVAQLSDLLANKLTTIQARSEAKDYLDIHAILERSELTLAEGLAIAEQQFSSFNPLVSERALTYFGDGDLAELPTAVQYDLKRVVHDLNHSRNLDLEL